MQLFIQEPTLRTIVINAARLEPTTRQRTDLVTGHFENLHALTIQYKYSLLPQNKYRN